MLVTKPECRRVVRSSGAEKPRSGVRVGFRLATLLLLRIPEVRAALRIRRDSQPGPIADPETMADHLGMEPSYMRRILRELAREGLATVEEIPSSRGGPPHRSYGIDVDAVAAKLAR